MSVFAKQPDPGATRALAAYVPNVDYDSLPPHVVDLAKFCLIDSVACAVHGSAKTWSRIVEAYADGTSATGPCYLPGALARPMPPAQAALCLGAFAHAFELDCLRKPGAGVHPGATVALPALMMSQATDARGCDLIAAIVAGCEVMFRIGKATLHTPESIGFHAPGITGAFGAAAAAGRLLGLDPDRLANAFGLCASMSGGILKFARAGQGGMVKRLHLGRAAEAGITAAMLARAGFEAPMDVLEGSFGLLDVFCEKSDATLLTHGLGQTYEIETLCFKRYACHVTAQAPIQLLRDLMAKHAFQGGDIADLSFRVSEKILSHHSEREPADLTLAQYSMPFSVAVAAFRDPDDPDSFSDDILNDMPIKTLARSISLSGGQSKGWGAAMNVRLADGRSFSADADGFKGCPETPFSDADLEAKFRRLTKIQGEPYATRMLTWLSNAQGHASAIGVY
jgi:2-methylcitrate dehydratase PrpD